MELSLLSVTLKYRELTTGSKVEPIESYELLKTEEEREKEFQGKEKSEIQSTKECNPVLLFEDGGAV